MLPALSAVLLAALLLGCGSDGEPGGTKVIVEPPQGGSGGSGGQGEQGGAGQAGSAPGGASGGSAPGGAPAAGQGGAGQAGSGQAGSGQAGQAGSAQAGGPAAGSPPGGSGGSGGSLQGGEGGGGSGPAGPPEVAFVKPAEGAEVSNPVAFSLTAKNVDSVSLVVDDQYTLPLSWDVQSKQQHDFTYSFSTLGQRSLVLSGYLSGQTSPAAEATRLITVVNPAGAICDGASGATFKPPSVCDKLSGNTTSEIPSNGYFSTSWFGCYFGSNGSIVQDPGDNCEFACGNKGLCPSSQDGPTCEANLKWFAADADRFGCGGRIRVTNCANGKSVVLTTLDKGPNCKSVEQKYGAPVLDMSRDAMGYLFDGKFYGGGDKKGVFVEKVDASTPLGPVE